MRTFIFRARKINTCWERNKVGEKGHVEIIAHCIMNAFFISNSFRNNIIVYIVFDSTPTFPITLKLSSQDGLSLSGFHEQAIFNLLAEALNHCESLTKDESRIIAPGVQINGYGFEKLLGKLMSQQPVFLLDKKGQDIRELNIDFNPAFILSDHLAMPKNSIKRFLREGLKPLSVGKKMLFASQCVVLINDEMDRRENG